MSVTSNDISFTANNTITTAGAVDFSVFSAGMFLLVEGSRYTNDGYYTIETVSATTITTKETVIVDEFASADITITEVPSATPETARITFKRSIRTQDARNFIPVGHELLGGNGVVRAYNSVGEMQTIVEDVPLGALAILMDPYARQVAELYCWVERGNNQGPGWVQCDMFWPKVSRNTGSYDNISLALTDINYVHPDQRG